MKRLAEKTIVVGAGKGGVGKSTLALNLAVAMAAKGLRVAILDADLYGPSLPLMTGLRNLSPPQTHKREVTPFHKFGVHILSMGFFMDEAHAIVWRGPMLHAMLDKLINQAKWPDLDYLFVDLPPGTGDVPLSLAKLLAIDGGIVVTTPQEVSFVDVAKACGAFHLLKIPVTGLIENMVGPPFGQSRGNTFAKRLGIPFLGSIPVLASLCESGDAGIPYAFAHPGETLFAPLADNLHHLYGERKNGVMDGASCCGH